MNKKKNLSERERDELRVLRERMLLTIGFIEESGDRDGVRVGEVLRAAIDKAALEQDLLTLRILSRELDGAALALEPSRREELDAVLNQRLGVNKNAERMELRRRAANAVKRGKIASEKERQHLQYYLESLEQAGGEAVEIAAIKRLLDEG